MIVYNVSVENAGFKDVFMVDAVDFAGATKKAQKLLDREPLYAGYEINSITKVGEIRGERRHRKASGRKAH